jgi:hypothetical protein
MEKSFDSFELRSRMLEGSCATPANSQIQSRRERFCILDCGFFLSLWLLASSVGSHGSYNAVNDEEAYYAFLHDISNNQAKDKRQEMLGTAREKKNVSALNKLLN